MSREQGRRCDQKEKKQTSEEEETEVGVTRWQERLRKGVRRKRPKETGGIQRQ